MIINQTKTALAPSTIAYFLADGTPPISYALMPAGAGGSINPTTGKYLAPVDLPEIPENSKDTILATDATGATATAEIRVYNPLLLFCEILARELELPINRIFLWNQKVFQPTDPGLYIAVSVSSCKAYSNGRHQIGDQVEQFMNVMATLDLNIMSRDNAALFHKEEVLLALGSTYALAQQAANGFLIGKLPPNARFSDLSGIDGAAIPYRFQISINMQYVVSKTKAVDYFDTFRTPEVTINP